MKKFVLVVLMLAMVATFAVAQDQFALDVGAGLYYNSYPLSGTAFDFLLIIFNLRGGIHGTLRYALSDEMSIGAELGVAYISASSGGTTSSLFDIPLYAVFRYDLGGMAVQPYTGLIFFGSSNSAGGGVFEMSVPVGARIVLGGIYLEGAYEISMAGASANFPSHARFGIGWQADSLAEF